MKRVGLQAHIEAVALEKMEDSISFDGGIKTGWNGIVFPSFLRKRRPDILAGQPREDRIIQTQ